MYVQNYHQIGTLVVSDQMLTAVSRQIDQAACQVYEDLRWHLWQSPEHLSRVHTIQNQPRNYISMTIAPVLLQGASAFEQMIALEHWLSNNTQLGPLRQRYTFCFSNSTTRLYGRAVPLSIEKNAQNMWRVKLGNKAIEYHAPTYKNDWDHLDPWATHNSENFIYHLEALEMVRQPHFIGATLIKGNAFESETIDQDWRYGVTDLNGQDRREACVEFAKQNQLPRPKTAIKTQSAAFNLLQLIGQGHGDVDLCDHALTNVINHFDSPEQISPHFSLNVTANEIWEACNETYLCNGRSALYYKMFNLMLAKIRPQTTPILRAFIIERFRQAPFKLPIGRRAIAC